MKTILKTLTVVVGLGLFAALSGCAPEVGSEKWCAKLQDKPKGDWTANELADFTQHCLLK